MVSEVQVFGLSFAELAIVAVAIGYVVSLVRDWRPMKALREENRGLRTDLNVANEKIHDLELQVDQLKKATDLTEFQREQRKIAEVLQGVVEQLQHLDGSVRGNTAAIEVIARRAVIDDALEDDRGRAA